MKATIKRPDGTVIEAEGSVEEIQKLAAPLPLAAPDPNPVKFDPSGALEKALREFREKQLDLPYGPLPREVCPPYNPYNPWRTTPWTPNVNPLPLGPMITWSERQS